MIEVLIIEDDPMVAMLNEKYVQSVKGFKVVGKALDGDEGITLAKKLTPDLIILDIHMPKTSGLTVLKSLRQDGYDIDAILVTAENEISSIDEVLKWGAIDYLVKPFEFQRFKIALENYKDRTYSFRRKGKLSQEEIDKVMLGSNANKQEELDKGIQKKTLEKVRNYLRENPTGKTASQVAEDLTMSRVTARRYLEYLVDTSEISLEISYGTVGRPQHLYIFKG